MIKIAVYTVAITGASGAIYAKRLLEFLLKNEHDINLIISEIGKEIVYTELGVSLTGEKNDALKGLRKLLGVKGVNKSLRYYNAKDINAPLASGSRYIDGMIIIPCSMGTLSRIAHGVSTNLIERGADVMLKEKRPLVIVPRETPLNAIHLQNMLSLTQMGVHMVPAMPAFYYHPATIDDLVLFMVGRVLDLLKIKHSLFARWKEEE